MIPEIRAILLLLLGNATLRLASGEQYLSYVKPEMRLPLLISGALLSVLGAALLVQLVLRPAPRVLARTPGAPDHQLGDDRHEDQQNGGHPGHHHPGARAAWLLVLPVFAILLIAPPALGSYTADRFDGTVREPATTSDLAALPGPDPVALPLGEYAVRAVWDDGTTLQGRAIELTGFVTRGQGEGWFLTRMSLVCCAADAYPTKVEVRGLAAPPVDTWVRLAGGYAPSTDPDPERAVPVIQALSAQPIDPPAQPYE